MVSMIPKLKSLIKTYDSRSARVDGNNSRLVNSSCRDSAAVAAGRHGSASRADSGGDSRGTVVLETKSSVEGLSDDQLEGAEVSADLRVLIEGGSNTSSLGGTDVNTVAEAGREGGGLTLSGGLNDQNITGNTLAALNNEVNIEGSGNDVSVKLGADQVLEGSGGSACRRASAGGSRVGGSSAGGGAVTEARLDGSESNARSRSTAV